MLERVTNKHLQKQQKMKDDETVNTLTSKNKSLNLLSRTEVILTSRVLSSLRNFFRFDKVNIFNMQMNFAEMYDNDVYEEDWSSTEDEDELVEMPVKVFRIIVEETILYLDSKNFAYVYKWVESRSDDNHKYWFNIYTMMTTESEAKAFLTAFRNICVKYNLFDSKTEWKFPFLNRFKFLDVNDHFELKYYMQYAGINYPDPISHNLVPVVDIFFSKNIRLMIQPILGDMWYGTFENRYDEFKRIGLSKSDYKNIENEKKKL
jgi:hypothetical protein